ncbi:unnamed protein product [Symbiodinium sp. KB8]|nr:unnamed protein product [Symbiodinium sp. KB8]
MGRLQAAQYTDHGGRRSRQYEKPPKPPSDIYLDGVKIYDLTGYEVSDRINNQGHADNAKLQITAKNGTPLYQGVLTGPWDHSPLIFWRNEVVDSVLLTPAGEYHYEGIHEIRGFYGDWSHSGAISCTKKIYERLRQIRRFRFLTPLKVWSQTLKKKKRKKVEVITQEASASVPPKAIAVAPIKVKKEKKEKKPVAKTPSEELADEMSKVKIDPEAISSDEEVKSPKPPKKEKGKYIVLLDPSSGCYYRVNQSMLNLQFEELADEEDLIEERERIESRLRENQKHLNANASRNAAMKETQKEIMYVSRWNRRRKKPLMIKDSSAPDDEEWELDIAMTEIVKYCQIARDKFVRSNPDKEVLDGHYEIVRHQLADALDCKYAIDIMRRYQNRGMLIKTPTDEPPAPSMFMGVKGDPTTDIALIHHFCRHREVRPKQGGQKKQIWACHGAVCRITFGFHSNIPEAKEWIHPQSGQRLNREEYQSYTGIDPLKGKNPDRDGPQDITYLCPEPWMTTSDLDPTPVLAQWNGIAPGEEVSPADLETYAETFYQEAPSDLSEIWCTKGPFKVITVALVHFNSLMTHKESRRLELVKAFLAEVLPFKPDIITGDLNNLASRLKYTGGDVHPRNGLFTLYLEKMLAAYNRMADRLPSDPKQRYSDLDCINAYVIDWGKTPHTATPSQKTDKGHPEVLSFGRKAIAGTTNHSLRDQLNRNIHLQGGEKDQPLHKKNLQGPDRDLNSTDQTWSRSCTCLWTSSRSSQTNRLLHRAISRISNVRHLTRCTPIGTKKMKTTIPPTGEEEENHPVLRLHQVPRPRKQLQQQQAFLSGLDMADKAVQMPSLQRQTLPRYLTHYQVTKTIPFSAFSGIFS